MRVYGQIRKRYPRLRPAVRGEEIRAIHRRQHRILRPAVVGVRVSVPLPRQTSAGDKAAARRDRGSWS